METKEKRRNVVVSVLALSGLLMFSLSAIAGDLEPSAPPGPTMKTLDEVEPRVPIHSSDLPLIIIEPNSYYLAEDINFTDNTHHAVTIVCNDVTIDLMGYTLKGPDSGNRSGIYIADEKSNVEVRNGTVRDFGERGIYGYGSTGKNYRIIAVRSVSNGPRGIFLGGSNHLVKGCTVSNNGNSATSYVYGIYVGNGSTVTGNTVYDNGNSATGNYVYGIYTGDGSTVTDNTVCYNGYYASYYAYGIFAGSGCTVTGNIARDNGISAGSVVYGIYTSSGSTVTSNTVDNNGDSAGGSVYGIYLVGNNFIDRNTAYNNNGTNMRSCGTCTFGLNHAP